MRRAKTLLALTLALLLLVVAVGCGGSKKQPEPEPAPAPTETTEPEETSWKPTKQVEMVVPYSAGGSTDLLARAVEKVWNKYVDQPLVVVNKAGAGAIEGRQYVITSPADGHILMMGYGSGEDLVTPHIRQLPIDPFKDLVAVCRLSIHSVIVAVPADSPHNSIADLVNWSKETGEPITAAVSTAAGSVDLVMRGIGAAADVPVTPIPHAGGSQAVTTLVGGQTHMGGGHPSEIMPHVNAGRLKAIGVATPERDPVLPDIPTLIEQGIDFYTWGSVKGIAVAKGTPPEAIKYWEEIFKKISEDAEFKAAMADLLQPIQYLNSQEYTEFMAQAHADYGDLIERLGIETEK